MLKFRHIPTAGRVIIVAVAVGVFAIAGVACWKSYNAIYELVADLALYGDKTNKVFPLLVDAAFLVAEMAAILGVIMHRVTRSDEVSPGWPMATMIICGACTIAFNVGHAYLVGDGGWADPLTKFRCVVAALPPLLMILSFQVLIAIVKWVMLRLGRPEQAFAAAGQFLGVPQQSPQMQSRTWGTSELGQGGQWGSGARGEVGGKKKPYIVAELERLGTEEAIALGPEGIAAEVGERHQISVTPRYVRQVMDEHAGGRNGHGRS